MKLRELIEQLQDFVDTHADSNVVVVTPDESEGGDIGDGQIANVVGGANGDVVITVC